MNHVALFLTTAPEATNRTTIILIMNFTTVSTGAHLVATTIHPSVRCFTHTKKSQLSEGIFGKWLIKSIGNSPKHCSMWRVHDRVVMSRRFHLLTHIASFHLCCNIMGLARPLNLFGVNCLCCRSGPSFRALCTKNASLSLTYGARGTTVISHLLLR